MSPTGPGDSWKHQLGIKDLRSPPTTGTPAWIQAQCARLTWEWVFISSLKAEDTFQVLQGCTELNSSSCSGWRYMINIASNLSFYNIPPIFLFVMFAFHQVTVLVIPPLFACPLEEASFLLLIKSLIFTKIIPTPRWLDSNLSLSHK